MIEATFKVVYMLIGSDMNTENNYILKLCILIYAQRNLNLLC